MNLIKWYFKHLQKNYFCFLFGIDDIAVAALVGVAVSAITTGVSTSINSRNQSKANQSNLAFSNMQFGEQQMLNRNGFQIQAEDMQKAGLNPLSLTNNNLSAGSYASNQQATQVDLSPISQLASSYIQARSQDKMNKDSIDASKEVASIQAETQKSIAEQQLLEDKRHNIELESIESANSSANVKYLNSLKDDVDESFNGRVIENESALHSLYLELLNGTSGKSSNTWADLSDWFVNKFHRSFNPSNYNDFKQYYLQYLKDNRPNKD